MEEKTILKNKLIEDVDDKVWGVFTGWCKMNSVKVSTQLIKIIKAFLKKEKIKV